MRIVVRPWPMAMLTTAVLCCGSATVWGQSYPIADPGYAVPNSGNYSVSATNFNAGEASLADEVAELKAWKAEMLKKEAAANKKAAGKPSVKAGGRIQWDLANYDQDAVSLAHPYGNLLNGSEFRRARIFLRGDAFHVVDYKLQFDFADSNAVFKDVYITVNELPILQHVRFGHFKEPFGLEQLGSARYITFMERSLSDEGAIVPARNTGVMAFGHSESENLTWAIGGFRYVLAVV